MKTKINHTYDLSAQLWQGIGLAIGRKSLDYKKKTVVEWMFLFLCFTFELTITKFKYSGDRVSVQCNCDKRILAQ